MTRVRRRCIEVESNILQVEGIVVILRSRFDIVANSAYSRSCGQTYAERTGPSPQLCSPAGPHRAAHGTDRAEQVGEAVTLAGATGAAASSFGQPTRVVRSFGRAPTGRGLRGARASRSQCRTSASVARSIRHRFVRPGRIVDRHTNRLGEPAGSTAAQFDSRCHIKKKDFFLCAFGWKMPYPN